MILSPKMKSLHPKTMRNIYGLPQLNFYINENVVFKSGWLDTIPNEKVSVCIKLYGNYDIAYGLNCLILFIIIMWNWYD